VNVAAAAHALLCAWFAATAAPQSPPASNGRVRVQVADCPGVPTEDVRRVLSVEIGDLLVDSSSADARDADALIIRCAGNLAFVEASGGGVAPIERIFPLDDFPGRAAPRALALLGVELLAARSAAVRERILARQSGHATSVPAVETAAPPAPAAPPAKHGRDVRIGLAAVDRSFGASNGASALGGRIEATAPVLAFGLASADLELVAQQKDVAGEGRTAAWLMSAGATLGAFVGRGRWRAALGLGARVGLVRESGTAADPTRVTTATFVRPWGGPMLSARLSGTLGRVGLTVGGEAGWSLPSIDELAGGATAIAVAGPWLAFSIGADLRVR
jgi:hypothetical protein